MKQQCLALSRECSTPMWRNRDEVEALEGQKRTLPMSVVSVVQTLECTTGSVGGCGEQKKDSCMKHSRGLSTGERIFISLIP